MGRLSKITRGPCPRVLLITLHCIKEIFVSFRVSQSFEQELNRRSLGSLPNRGFKAISSSPSLE